MRWRLDRGGFLIYRCCQDLRKRTTQAPAISRPIGKNPKAQVPERGFPGERPDLKLDCACRKPKPGLVLRAARDLNIDLRASWFVGDSTTDLATASNAGVRSILVRTGHAGQDSKFAARPDYVFETLAEAVQCIVSAGNAPRISSDKRGATGEFKGNTIQD